MANELNKSKHFSEHRKKREEFIINTIGIGEDLDSFDVFDTKYNNWCVHTITDTGVYKITNKETGYLITMWIARPQQLKDLYRENKAQLPKWLLQKAIDHKQMGYCFIGENNPHDHHAHRSPGDKLRAVTRKSQRRSKVIY